MFEKLVGNDEIKKILEQAVKSNNNSHSYIFSGVSGIGKRLFAQEFAKHVLCLKESNCGNTCDSCIKFTTNNHPDYMLIEPEGKVVRIDQIRKMQEKIAEKPILSQNKIYIINDADVMTEESQNCLLKTLEEPPEYAIIILVVSNTSKLLATIKSRCVTIKFSKISDSELKQHFKDYTDEQIKLLDGSFKNIETIEQRQEEYQSIKKIVALLEKGSLLDLIEQAELLYLQKEGIIEILNMLNIALLEKNILEPIKYVEETKRKILWNNNFEMCIDYLLMNSWKSIRSK